MDWLRKGCSEVGQGCLEVGHFAKHATLPEYNNKSFLDRQSPDWMSCIHDEMPIWALTIPGTHDTCALHGGDLVECQSLNLSTQLEAGIRFLDVRARHYNNSLPIHHGIVFQNKNFSSVMQDVTTFLKNHPRECVLMQVQKEHESANNTVEFDALVESVCREYADFLPQCPETDIGSVTLGQLRGKVVILQNYDASINVQGAVCRGHWVDQNSWDHSMNEIASLKISRIKEHFENTRHYEGTLRRNWLSAASASAWPHAVARLTNPIALQYLQGREPHPQGHGIIISDFPGSELIAQCIRHSVGTSQARFGG